VKKLVGDVHKETGLRLEPQLWLLMASG
jgi:hypothetical protein